MKKQHINNANLKLIMAKATREAPCYRVYQMVLVLKENRELKGSSVMIALTPLPPGSPEIRKYSELMRVSEGALTYSKMLV